MPAAMPASLPPTMTSRLLAASRHTAGAHDRALLLMTFACALRRSEFAALHVDDINRCDDGTDVAGCALEHDRSLGNRRSNVRATVTMMTRSMRSGTRTRDAILERAMDLASIEGLEGLTIGRLAAELGMSKSGLFGHFGSKEDLQLATLKAADTVLWREVVEPAVDVTSGLDRLRALIEGYVRYLEREVFPGGCFLSAAAAEFDGRPGPVRDAVAAASRAWCDQLEGQAGIAVAKGELASGTDPALVAFELNALANGANAAFQLHGDRRAFEHARLAIARVLRSGGNGRGA
jgi:AcrR family transcriptional regulator